jgi:hypothetical protein
MDRSNLTAGIVTDTRSRPRGAVRPSLVGIFRPKRAWGMPGARCTRSLVRALVLKMRTSIHSEFTGIARHSRTQWLYDLYRALPGDRLVVTVAYGLWFSPPGRVGKTSVNLTPAPGRQDHTTSPYAHAPFVLRAGSRSRRAIRPATPSHARRCRVHRIPPRVRDDRDTPLLVGRDSGGCRVICDF